ncbi:UNVERIFIED_CONTAM: hypothetical protein FKN15_006894, partial [Acipenser sinensis]
RSEPINFYDYGPKDLATIFFYVLVAIILHALIQEYILDVKFFYICQIAYWLHALPELYFQKVRKEDIPRQLNYICLNVFHIAGAYILKFTLWALLFVMARLLTLTLSVLTFGFGLARSENQGFSISEGNFNVLTVRIGCLAAICLTQAWMMWKFINFQLKKWREHSHNQATKKKITSPKSRPSKKESNRGNSVNGVVKLEERTSPRVRKAKAS